MKYFKPYELVPKHIYEIWGDKSEYFIDSNLRKDIDRLREYLRLPLIINDWKWGGKFQYRGYRPLILTSDQIKDFYGLRASNNNILKYYSSKYFKSKSMHKLGCAIDCHSPFLTASELRQIVINNQEKFPYIKRIEDKVNWLHSDGLITDVKSILLFNK